ncbi:MAG: hypothetical protein KME12_04140 [Trichocoleus desertorum ATA4-8-CV12]|jgi:hypothetical protein|nr:hypothetical protein [Trichocoleus desertorum ATA4-8-CV12]
MLLDADDSSEGISRSELESFWGKELTGLTIAQRRVVIELYRTSRRQAAPAIALEEPVINIACSGTLLTEASVPKLA